MKYGGNLVFVWAKGFQGMAVLHEYSRFSRYDMTRKILASIAELSFDFTDIPSKGDAYCNMAGKT